AQESGRRRQVVRERQALGLAGGGACRAVRAGAACREAAARLAPWRRAQRSARSVQEEESTRTRMVGGRSRSGEGLAPEAVWRRPPAAARRRTQAVAEQAIRSAARRSTLEAKAARRTETLAEQA